MIPREDYIDFIRDLDEREVKIFFFRFVLSMTLEETKDALKMDKQACSKVCRHIKHDIDTIPLKRKIMDAFFICD